MKIISGKYKGRMIKGYDINGTRPTMNRIKESLFAMIQDYIKDSIVLDLYSGSGNLGIEAISNGAKKSYFVDNNNICINTIKDNLDMLKIVNAEVIKSDALYELKTLVANKIKFNIIFLDPPYKTSELDKILTYINSNLNILSNNGIVVCETQLKMDYEKYSNLIIYKNRIYKDKVVTILKRI